MDGNFNWPLCPAGSEPLYSIDNGVTFSTTPPDYLSFNDGDVVDLCFKCRCLADNTEETPPANVICDTVTIVLAPDCCDLDPTGTITVTPGTC